MRCAGWDLYSVTLFHDSLFAVHYEPSFSFLHVVCFVLVGVGMGRQSSFSRAYLSNHNRRVTLFVHRRLNDNGFCFHIPTARGGSNRWYP